MSVILRWKKYPSGTQSAYLDIYNGIERKYKFLDIKITRDDKEKKTKRDQAKDIRDLLAVEIQNKKYGLPSKTKGKISFLVYCQKFLDSYDKPGKRKYEGAIGKFKEYLKSRPTIKKLPFKDLTTDVMQGFKDYLYGPASGLSGETPYDYFKRLNAIIRIAVKDNYLRVNPCESIKVRKPKSNVKKQILSKEEIFLLANTKCAHEEVKRAFLFSCFTGLGEKEIKGLVWSNIQNGRIVIKRAKNQEEINNKLPLSAIKILGPRQKPNDRIFNLPSNTTVKKHLQNWVKLAKIKKDITFYCGRHSFAVMLMLNGANLKTVADALGHSDTSHTIKYLNYVDALKDKAMDKMIEIDI